MIFFSRICEFDNLIISKNAHLIERNVTCLNTSYLSVSYLWMLTLKEKITYEVKEKTWLLPTS